MRQNKRCWWCGDDVLYQNYHDTEWGVPLYDDRMLFEFLCLEGAQAGLSWITILRKRENYRKAFDNFNAEKIARYDNAKIASLLSDAGIVRNKLKLNAFIKNAKVFLDIRQSQGTFRDYLWDFVDGQPIQNQWENAVQVPANTTISDTMSKDMKNRGFSFVGTTICYAFMQATGMVNDHIVGCFRHQKLK